MNKLNIKVFLILSGLGFVSLFGWTTLIRSEDGADHNLVQGNGASIVIAHTGSSAVLERPPAVFDHSLHTTALKQGKLDDCGVCHMLKDTDSRLIKSDIKVFRFPKQLLDQADKTSIMYGYHKQCVSCHRDMISEGRKSGPEIGLCGKCHAKRAQVKRASWAKDPIFNYARHSKHVTALGKLKSLEGWNVAGQVEVQGEITPETKTCGVCHHTFDEGKKRLVYKKDTENSCRACHKNKDDKNSRAMNKAAHAACIGCHMKYREAQGTTPVPGGGSPPGLKASDAAPPFECRGCHGDQKDLKPDEILKVPRLVRGQKDYMDLSWPSVEPGAPNVPQAGAKAAAAVRMKAVPFDHKAHEGRGQFCNTCHHYSLEKCSTCHTPSGDPKKGGGISYERAFHKPGAKQSCVGCHEKAKADRKCAGCHQWLPDQASKASCAVCHRGPSEGRPIEVKAMPLIQDKEKVPEKVQVKGLEKEFKPAEFPHLKIVNKLISISNASTLAARSHSATDQTLCAGCHHRSDLHQAVVRVPQCVTCHGRSFDPAALGKPGLMSAYHRQCIGCHESMDQKPKALECVKCHPAKEGARTVGIIPSPAAPQ
ncbi:MAG: cytochrome c3 family protein [Pseudomonadota bacterium]